MNKILVTISAILMSTSLSYANPKAINTGGQNGAYHSIFCPPLPSVLSNAYFHGYSCTTSSGTVDNINRVLKQPTNIGFAQLDVFAREAQNRPEEFKRLSLIRSDLACEGLWMITKNPDLDFGKVLGLSRRIKFILPAQGSGSVASFNYLRSIDPDGLGRVSDNNILNVADSTAVINYVANSTQGEVGFFVQFADPRNVNIKLLEEKKLVVIPVISREILQAKVNDQNVYQAQTFSMTESGFFTKGKQATTSCTPVSIFTGSPEAFSERNAQEDAKDLIERVKQIPSDTLLPKDTLIANIIKGATKLSQSALENAVAAVEAAKKAASEVK